MSPQSRPGRNTRGQSTVEFAVLLPVLVIVLLAVAQAGLLVRDRLGAVNAARVGARAAALSPDVGSAEEAIRRHGIELVSGSVRLEGDLSPGGVGAIEVGVAASQVPLVGRVVKSVVLRERLAFRVEDPNQQGF